MMGLLCSGGEADGAALQRRQREDADRGAPLPDVSKHAQSPPAPGSTSPPMPLSTTPGIGGGLVFCSCWNPAVPPSLRSGRGRLSCRVHDDLLRHPPGRRRMRWSPPPLLLQAHWKSETDSRTQTGGLGYGTTVELNFCTSCSYRGNALTIKKMLETSFPGIDVVLSNYPPPLPKRLLSKMVPVVQAGVFGIVMAGDQILPRLGYVVLPPWYHSLRANRFGTIASTWLFGNVVQNFLQSSGAFEVYCNGDLVFSKLKEHRFPGEIELRNMIKERIGSPRFGAEGSIWS